MTYVIYKNACITNGLHTHTVPTLPITEAPKLIKLLTEDIERPTCGKFVYEPDPFKAVDGIKKHIIAIRKALGLTM